MNFIKQIKTYAPVNIQEKQDRKVLLDYIKTFPHNILLRENEFAHITSSGFIMNKSLDKVLMIHHNILKTWAWTGGHMDGENDLLAVALREAREETGVIEVTPLTGDIGTLDILTVNGHIKNGGYVSSHLHLSIGYILIADENERLVIKEDENSDVRWFSLEEFNGEFFHKNDLYLYRKLIDRAISAG